MKKKAFITGGSRGIGAGIARVLAESGYDIAFTYNTQAEAAEALQEEIIQSGMRCFIYQADLHKEDVPEEVTARAISDLGGIDLLVCNAGLTRHNTLLTLTQELIDYIYALNFRSYLLCAKTAASDMVRRGVKGNIIFITSTRSLRAYPEDAVYGGLKAALNRAAESMALEMAGYNIRVNCIAPGATAVRGDLSEESLKSGAFAQRIPLKRRGSPREVGYLVRYVASDEAAYMTGNIIKLDGGLILPGMPEINRKTEI